MGCAWDKLIKMLLARPFGSRIKTSKVVKMDKNDLTAHAMPDNSEDSGTEDILSDDFSGWIQMSSLLVV